DLKVSEIGFGAWAIGGAAYAGEIPIGWGKTDDRTSIKALKKAFTLGVNFYDTADFYGLGHSEELIGKVFGNDPGVIIASKAGHKLNADDRIAIDYSYGYLIEACEKSLKRLKRETIDYYQLHVAKVKDLEKGECIRAMKDLQQTGKIRYWGISLNTYDPEPEALCSFKHQIGDGFQVVLNIINQKILPLLPEMSRKGYGIIARMPLQFGLLSGKFSAYTRFSPDDHRRERLNPQILEDAEVRLNPVRELAVKYKTEPYTFALRFILSFPEISTVIPGIRNEEQVVRNTNDLRILEPDVMKKLQDLYTNDLADFLDKIKKFG
ncbi:MAG: aldo/keto reductase, partial [Bacteroidales bacterium]